MARGDARPDLHATWARRGWHHGPVGVGVGLLAFVVLAAVAPDTLATLAAKEGAVEGVSHVVLALAAIAWTARAARPGARTLAAVVAVSCAFVLAEELSWGAVYGFGLVADRIAAWAGRPDLHNAWSGGSYVLFALPVLAYAVHAWIRGPAASGWPGPDRADAIAVAMTGAGTLLGTLLWPAREEQLDEVLELYLYATMLWTAIRRRRSGDGAHPAESSKSTDTRS